MFWLWAHEIGHAPLHKAMKHKLFLTCPLCQLESFLDDKFGGNCLFISALGAVFDFSDINFPKRLSEFIIREQVYEVYVVNDTSCLFIHNVLKKKKDFFDTTAESVFLYTLIDNYKAINACKTMEDKERMMAEKNVQKQVEILSAALHPFTRIKGLITTKQEDKIKEITPLQ